MATSAETGLKSIPLGVFVDCEMIERSSSSILRLKVAHDEKGLARKAGDHFDIAFRPKDLERLKGAILGSTRARDLFQEVADEKASLGKRIFGKIFGH